VETNHAGEVFPGSREDIHSYLKAQGYIFDATVGKKASPLTDTLSQCDNRQKYLVIVGTF
jgi:hypothetical protein